MHSICCNISDRISHNHRQTNNICILWCRYCRWLTHSKWAQTPPQTIFTQIKANNLASVSWYQVHRNSFGVTHYVGQLHRQPHTHHSMQNCSCNIFSWNFWSRDHFFTWEWNLHETYTHGSMSRNSHSKWNFRTRELSLREWKFHRWNFHPLELLSLGTFLLKNKSNMKLSLPGAKVIRLPAQKNAPSANVISTVIFCRMGTDISKQVSKSVGQWQLRSHWLTE